MAYEVNKGADAPPPPEATGVPTRLIVAIVLVAVIGIFIGQNRKEVDVTFLFVDIEDVRLWTVIVVSLLLGALLTLALQWGLRRRRRRED